MNPKSPQVQFNDILLWRVLLALTRINLSFSQSLVPRTRPHCRAHFLLFLFSKLLDLDAVPSDIDSSVYSKQVLEALVVENNEVLVFLDFSRRLQQSVVQRIIVEG